MHSCYDTILMRPFLVKKPTAQAASLIFDLTNPTVVFLQAPRAHIVVRHQWPLLARQSTPADILKRDVEARVLTPSIPAGRCVAALWVAHSARRTYRLRC